MELPLLHPDIPVNETNAAQAREKVEREPRVCIPDIE